MGPILTALCCHHKLSWFPIKDTLRWGFLWNFKVSSAGQTSFNHTGLRLLFSILAHCLLTKGKASHFFSLFLNTSVVVEQTIVLPSLTQLLPRTDRACSSCSRTLTVLVSQDTTCHFFTLKEFYWILHPFSDPLNQYFKLQNYKFVFRYMSWTWIEGKYVTTEHNLEF